MNLGVIVLFFTFLWGFTQKHLKDTLFKALFPQAKVKIGTRLSFVLQQLQCHRGTSAASDLQPPYLPTQVAAESCSCQFLSVSGFSECG